MIADRIKRTHRGGGHKFVVIKRIMTIRIAHNEHRVTHSNTLNAGDTHEPFSFNHCLQDKKTTTGPFLFVHNTMY